MSSPAPFLDLIGFPSEGERVDPTPRAAEYLIAGGWTPPKEGCDHILEQCNCGDEKCTTTLCLWCEAVFEAPS
jgi:hypothetical protein